MRPIRVGSLSVREDLRSLGFHTSASHRFVHVTARAVPPVDRPVASAWRMPGSAALDGGADG